VFSYALDIATTTGGGEPYVATSGSQVETEAKPCVARFDVRIGASGWKKTLWCFGKRAENEVLGFPDMELPGLVVDHMEESAATEIGSPELAKHIEAIIRSLTVRTPEEDTGESGTVAEVVCGRTELGQRLRDIRRRIKTSGERLLGWDDVDCELRDRRGSRDSEDE
jgi:hypothetical protein